MLFQMGLDFESCQQNIDALLKYYNDNIGNRNEATTRLHLIDTLLFECLGWAKHEAYAEEPRDKKFADYVFYAPSKIMILEAKREGDYFEIPAGHTHISCYISSLCRNNRALKDAIQQVADYCQKRGVLIGSFSNGHQLVAFLASRDDGIAPLDGRCIVFPSLHFMCKHFLDLWNYLSKPGIEDRNLQTILLGSSRPQIPPRISSIIKPYPGIKGRNAFQSDLQVISEIILEDITRSPELEERFLKECYCQSGALSQHSLISKRILEVRYDSLFLESNANLSAISATTKKGISKELPFHNISKRPILLIGDMGVGKTMFIKRLINIEAVETFSKAISIYIDLGSQAIISSDLNNYIIDDIIKQLDEKYNINIYDNGLIRGIYKKDLNKFRAGIQGELATINPQKYAEKEIAFLESKVKDRAGHLRLSLQFISSSQQKQVIIFLDNADQRIDAIQDAAFLISQEFAQHWPTLIYVPLRPETFYRSTQVGALTGYHNKVFTISPPRADRVIQKRLNFALDLMSDKDSLPKSLQDPSLRINELRKIIYSFLKSIEYNENLMECIDNMVGGNMRLALDLVRGFFGSGHVDTKKIVDLTNDKYAYTVSLHEFLRAVIYGDATHYDPDRSPVANLYDVSRNDPKEHFLLPLLLNTLHQEASAKMSNGSVSGDILYERMQSYGFTADQIDFAVVRAFRKRLIHTPANQLPDLHLDMPLAFRITTIGLYHTQCLCRLFEYNDAIIVATPIFDQNIYKEISDVSDIFARLDRCEIFRHYLDNQWENYITSYCQTIEHIPFDWRIETEALKDNIQRVKIKAERSSY